MRIIDVLGVRLYHCQARKNYRALYYSEKFPGGAPERMNFPAASVAHPVTIVESAVRRSETLTSGRGFFVVRSTTAPVISCAAASDGRREMISMEIPVRTGRRRLVGAGVLTVPRSALSIYGTRITPANRN